MLDIKNIDSHVLVVQLELAQPTRYQWSSLTFFVPFFFLLGAAPSAPAAGPPSTVAGSTESMRSRSQISMPVP